MSVAFTRAQAVSQIESLVQGATDKLEQAYRLANQWGIPFQHDLTAKVDEEAEYQPEWQSSDDHWYSSSC